MDKYGRETYYITTPIYYPSDNLHIGHAYTTVAADALARYKRMTGYDVRFLTGSDEHGQKIERKAKAQGTDPKSYVDPIVDNFKKLWAALGISYDDFIRTTEERHIRGVQHIFKTIYDKGDIYKSEYEGWYCTPCETFWPETKLVEGNCPDCGRPVELIKEESYFFRMSKYQDQWLQFIESHPDFIQPASRQSEMINFVKQGLEDLCVSRTTFKWGIPVPVDSNHVIYVWFDALSNYITALGQAENDPLFQRYWPCDVHLVGKDIMRFHTIIWPIISMAAGLELPKKVFGHGWLLLQGGKMSKSKGNVVDPLELISRYGVEAVRYYLLRELPFGQDGYYSEEALVLRINADLANDFGNLLSRATSMIEKFNGGVILKPAEEAFGALEQELRDMALGLPQEVANLMEKLELSNALGVIWRLVGRANKYIDERAPWALAKEPQQKSLLEAVLYTMAETLRVVTVLITPFLPTLPARVWEQLGLQDQAQLQSWDSLNTWGAIPDGIRINRGNPLFPRLELPQTEEVVAEEKKEPVESKKVAEVQTKMEDKKAEDAKPEITIEDFAKVDLRVAEVLSARKVEKADKLLELRLKLGEEERTVVSGIALHYSPEEMVGKKVVLVANLKPTKLRGILSQGMILAASDDNSLEVLTVQKEIPSGNRVK